MRNIMRRFGSALVLAVAVTTGTILLGSAQAAPLALPGQLGAAADTLNIIERAQYVYGGRRHCWYDRGWHGPGWYWCGYAWRRGYGWGGPRGWNDWVWGGWGPGPGYVIVPPRSYYYGGRYYRDRYWYGGRWRYR
jgi:hypothetical protein